MMINVRLELLTRIYKRIAAALIFDIERKIGKTTLFQHSFNIKKSDQTTLNQCHNQSLFYSRREIFSNVH